MPPLRVAGTDPGTSSLDILVLEDGRVADQARFAPDAVRADPAGPVRWLEERGPLALVAGPSGYGLPLARGRDLTAEQAALLALVRADERGRAAGVAGFTALVRAFAASPLPVVFLPGVVHLPTVPDYRKANRIDLGTPDKLCVAALGLALSGHRTFCAIEAGSVFAACLVVESGTVVDGAGGTSGPAGWSGGGAWDGELAYLLSPLGKADLFAPGCGGDAVAYRESLKKTVAGLRAVTPFERVLLSGRLPETNPGLVPLLSEAVGGCELLGGLPGAWVKHAAQGAALVADGLCGGRFAPVVESLRLRQACGTVFDWLTLDFRARARRALDLPPADGREDEPGAARLS